MPSTPFSDFDSDASARPKKKEEGESFRRGRKEEGKPPGIAANAEDSREEEEGGGGGSFANFESRLQGSEEKNNHIQSLDCFVDLQDDPRWCTITQAVPY